MGVLERLDKDREEGLYEQPQGCGLGEECVGVLERQDKGWKFS